MENFLEVLQYLFSILWIIILIGAMIFICILAFKASWKTGLCVLFIFLFTLSLLYYLS